MRYKPKVKYPPEPLDAFHLPSIEYYLQQFKRPNQSVGTFSINPSIGVLRTLKPVEDLLIPQEVTRLVPILPKSTNFHFKYTKRSNHEIQYERRHWSNEEDAYLQEVVQEHHGKSWKKVAKFMYFRSPKQCRDRWHTQLKEGIDKTKWTNKEDAILLENQKHIGNKWAILAKQLPGHTATSIKNRYRSLRLLNRKCKI